MSEHAVTSFSIEEFVEWEERRPERHELVGSRAYARTGGTERHALMAGHLALLLTPGARSAGCRTFRGDRKLRTATGDLYYPDVMVTYGRAADRHYEADASLLVEVLSPSTRAQDRREKVRQYGSPPSIGQYVIVEPDIRRIEVATWTSDHLGWSNLGPGDQLATPFGTFDVDDVYDQVDGDATT